MQKCDIDWPICNHEPMRIKKKSRERIWTKSARFSNFLTCVGDVEKERHSHHYMRSDQHVAPVVIDEEIIRRTIREAERNQEERERWHS